MYILFGIKINNKLNSKSFVPVALFDKYSDASCYANSCMPTTNNKHFKEDSLLFGYDFFDIKSIMNLPKNPNPIPITEKELQFLKGEQV